MTVSDEYALGYSEGIQDGLLMALDMALGDPTPGGVATTSPELFEEGRWQGELPDDLREWLEERRARTRAADPTVAAALAQYGNRGRGRG